MYIYIINVLLKFKKDFKKYLRKYFISTKDLKYFLSFNLKYLQTFK